MGVGYCTIKYTFGGKEYNCQHTLHAGSNFAIEETTFTEVEAQAWGLNVFDQSGSGTRTDPNDAGFGPSSLIEAVIALHRQMQGPEVTLTQLYLHDGPTEGTPTGAFAVRALNYQCRNITLAVGVEAYAPANIALMIDKSPLDFSRFAGRMWLRGALLDTEVRPSAVDGVQLTVGGATRTITDLQAAVANVGLGTFPLADYFASGATGSTGTLQVQYGIGRTRPINPADPDGPRELFGFTRIEGLSVDDAQSRDTRRRKRPPTAAALALSKQVQQLEGELLQQKMVNALMLAGGTPEQVQAMLQSLD